MGAVVAEGRAAQQPLGDLAVLAKELAGMRHVDGARVVFDPGHTATETDMQVGVGHQAQHRQVFGEAHRLVPGQHDDGGAQSQAGAGCGDVAQEEQRRGRGVVVGKVVLQYPDAAEAECLPEAAVIQHLAVALPVAGGAVLLGRHHRAHGEAEGRIASFAHARVLTDPACTPQAAQKSRGAGPPGPCAGLSVTSG